MSATSDSDSDCEKKTPPPRLGPCEVCGSKMAIYTCPKCEVKTCSVSCVRIHKEELDCSGVRDRTKFIKITEFTDTDLLSDYRLLEECARFVYSVKRNEKNRFLRSNKEIPTRHYKLRLAARKRGTVLQFLSKHFSRHSLNTTKYDFKTDVIYWRVEWIFPNVDSDPLKFVDDMCSEQMKLSACLDKYLNPDAPPFNGSKDLVYYKSAGFSGVKVLLKAEKLKGSCKKFFELDTTESLAENLSGKCILEFPIIFIVLKDHAYNFEIITRDEDFDYKINENKETESKKDEIMKSESKLIENSIKNDENKSTDNDVTSSEKRPCVDDSNQKKRYKTLTEIIAEEKKMEIAKEIKEDKKKRPKNLLFTTGYSSEESMSSESENEDEK